MKLLCTVLLLSSLIGCGFNKYCDNDKSYKLNDQYTSSVGSPMLQTGCFKAKCVPRGIYDFVFHRSDYDDNWFTPRVDKELLYTGRNGDVVNVTYREYTSEGYARNAFYQQLVYDLKASNSMVFQDWIIDIVDAGNSNIKFKVVKEPISPPAKYLERCD